ncbi:DEAD/DEAH box helicase [Aeromonas sp. sia0103]|uniref:DEAD/DEAH box helicase n=1 Tax=Aeromonas sp. sia0103 TaxID=2854782 RepID=UPI001C462AD2|nr:DEAD/DEAH box helicase [Aeromonas sp. sia0103]MBV7597726.1 DEAD/DEAH box helicase [Aeromonas sp. sia0103]
MDIFTSCHKINDLITSGSENNAREELIKLLDYHEREGISYSPLLNSLIRQVGLYPYLQTETSSWQDQFVYESFKTNVGPDTKLTLHREQSSVLKRLLEGQNLAVSAPTSFGKSFIIDAFISIKRPKNVVIIVPTIALTDETRRRLQKKFSNEYKIITTSDVEISEKNIFIFPQERSINYLEKLDEIDILVVDEFYKASQKFDKERASSLTKAIIKLSTKARQKYFLAPNISSLNDNILTKDMVFLPIDFNTVFLEMNELYKEIKKDENLKSETLLNILNSTKGKTLIYAGTYPNINKVATLLIGNKFPIPGEKLKSFEKWLTINYERNWNLTSLVKRGCGIHNGQMHRSLSQIQIRLFEEEDGLKNIISTSSIIEGVNTSAENVVIWANKNGQSRLNDFTYRNIIGRGGRMFKHFIGKIYILEEPPVSEEVELNLNLPDNILSSIDSEEIRQDLTPEQISKIIAYENEMSDLLGDETFTMMKGNSIFDSSDGYLIRDIARDISSNKDEWNGLGFLNSAFPDDWDRFLYKAINFHPGGWGIEYWKFVEFIKVISNNWNKSIPELLEELEQYDIGIDEFFKLERNITFKLSATFNDINILQKKMLEKPTDISPFISKLSHAFLPPLVYQLEEYGLPRMITKKIHQAKIINFEHPEIELHIVLNIFKTIPLDILITLVPDLDVFDKYILSYFYDGI